jgi:DNA-binding MarR family transcriptional regulator
MLIICPQGTRYMPADPRSAASEVDLALRRRQADTLLAASRLLRCVERHVARTLTAHGLADVTPQQANVLMILFQERGPLRAAVLAERMGLSAVTVGRFVHALDRAGWIVRRPDPHDSRAMLVAPTKKAFTALPRFIATSNALLDRAFSGFDATAVRKIARTTERMVANLEPDASDEGGGRVV